MTAVVLAASYAEAYDAAQHLGLGRSWVYPHDLRLLDGLAVSRVVYVDGWTQSAALTVEIMEALSHRTNEATPITHVVPGEAAAPVLSAPFIETTAPDPTEAPQRRPRWAIPSGWRAPIAVVLSLGWLVLIATVIWGPL